MAFGRSFYGAFVTPLQIRTTLFLSTLTIGLSSAHLHHFQDGPVVCPFRLLTGYPCPGCGLTRAIGNATTGHFLLAINLNPLIIVIGIAVLAMFIAPNATRNWIGKFLGQLENLPISTRIGFGLSAVIATWGMNCLRIAAGLYQA